MGGTIVQHGRCYCGIRNHCIDYILNGSGVQTGTYRYL